MPTELSQDSNSKAASRNAGLYVHIPFCLSKCRYCDFYSITDASLIAPWLAALVEEFRLRATTGMVFDTLYLGGGTPSVLATGQIQRIVQAVHRYFTLLSDSEISIEVNPGSADSDKLAALRAMGFNRLTIGVQSLDDTQLRWLGRGHTAQEGRDCIRAARRAGFDNLGLDLIYGLPGQSLGQWQKELETALELAAPEHLSCYMLTYEPQTPLERQRRAGIIRPLSERRVADLFSATIGFLTGQGYEHYEISNFARRTAYRGRDFRSRHNGKYWDFAPYLGFGPSAHSYLPPERSWNHRSVSAYVADIEAGRLPRGGCEILTPGQEMMETILLGLRTCRGIDLSGFQKRFGLDFMRQLGGILDPLQKEGLLISDRNRCYLTSQGMLMLDGIVERLVSGLPER